MGKSVVAKHFFIIFFEVRHIKTGVIFGKFYPIHLGHIDFIQRISIMVDKLYVVVCTDLIRDDKLFLNSGMKNRLPDFLRLKFVSDSFKFQSNIEIIHLKEDGIASYPNGWLDWSSRVKQLFENRKITFNKIFCNETQDVENYYKYFSEIENLEVITLDVNREKFDISATKIRSNPQLYWKYIPINARFFFSNKIAFVSKDIYRALDYTEKISNYYNSNFYDCIDFDYDANNKFIEQSIFTFNINLNTFDSKISFFSINKDFYNSVCIEDNFFDLIINLDDFEFDDNKLYDHLLIKINELFNMD